MRKLKLDGLLNIEKIPLYELDAFFICDDKSLINELKKIIVETGVLSPDRIKDFFKKMSHILTLERQYY